MAAEIVLEIVTPEGSKLREQVTEFTAPSVEGEFGVLPGHLPILATLRTGLVRWRAGGAEGACAVAAGFIEFSHDHCTILTDKYVAKSELDPVRVRATLKDVDHKIEHFGGAHSSPEFRLLVEEELWCAAQLELHGDPPPPTVNFAPAYGPALEADRDEATASAEVADEQH
jgi:F-type H+-transporting ATPase subunit epsilon